MRRVVSKTGLSFIIMLLLSACGSDNRSSSTDPSTSVGEVPSEQSSYQSLSPNREQFIWRMVNKYNFDHQQLRNILAQTQELDWIIRLMDKQAPTPSSTVPNGAWLRYKNKFVTTSLVSQGVDFWNTYESELNRAYAEYGVPPEIIVGIIGVETNWGRQMGKTRIIDALATLSFAYPRRADYFADELEDFLLMSRDGGIDPFDPTGSYAGAMGYGQFMPSAFKHYAVDFNQNGYTDLWDPIDTIGSVANYFKAHGWQEGGIVAVKAKGQAPTLEHGFNTLYSLNILSQAGLTPIQSLDDYDEANLLRLDMGNHYEYWYGLPNFYVITRYNHSTYYAMAVWQLGEEVKAAR